MGEHGAHDDMQVPGQDRLTIHAREVIECGLAVAALVLPIDLLNLSIVDQWVMRMPGGRDR
jgi:hypothetical protein